MLSAEIYYTEHRNDRMFLCTYLFMDNAPPPLVGDRIDVEYKDHMKDMYIIERWWQNGDLHLVVSKTRGREGVIKA